MKKNYLIAFALLSLTFLKSNAQFSDDFESYPLGPYYGTNWSTWTGVDGAQNIIISNNYAFDGNNSGLIAGGQIQDVMLVLGNKTTGSYRLSFQMYIPAGKSGYMSIQGSTTANGGAGNGGSGYFNSKNLLFNNVSSASGSPGTGGAYNNPTDASPLYTWLYPEGVWFPIIIDFDVDNGAWTMNIDGTLLDTRYFGVNGVLGAMNFYSLTSNNEVYIDAINFENTLSVNEESNIIFKSYPNPVKDYLYLTSNSKVESVEVYDILGHQIISSNPEIVSPKIDFRNIASGTYFVKCIIGNQSKTLKIIK